MRLRQKIKYLLGTSILKANIHTATEYKYEKYHLKTIANLILNLHKCLWTKLIPIWASPVADFEHFSR